jgi:hypothetical protein
MMIFGPATERDSLVIVASRGRIYREAAYREHMKNEYAKTTRSGRKRKLTVRLGDANTERSREKEKALE